MPSALLMHSVVEFSLKLFSLILLGRCLVVV
jgi:hypothetical protein